MALVRETADGQYEVVDGETVTSHESRKEALYGALDLNGGRTKDAILHDPDTSEPNGAWRWLHATDEEDEAYGGARIDAQTVREAIASLNASPKGEPINGGMADSPAHGPAGDTPATGYAHHGVEFVDADGRVGAYVLAELLPEVDRNVASGRIAFTSIGVGGTVAEADAPIRDTEWDHLALTNKPAVPTLTPSAAIRDDGRPRLVAVRSHRLTRAARPKGNPMPAKTSVRSEIVKPLALRGPALDALTAFCKSLSISIDDELSSDSWSSPANAALSALREGAKYEKLLESLTGATQESARSAFRAVLAPALRLRAEIDDAKWGELAKAAGLAEGASVDDVIAAVGKMKPADDADETEEVEMTEKDKATAEAKEAARDQTVETLRAEVATLRAKDQARDDAEWLDATIAKRGATVSPETRSKFERAMRADRKDGRELVAGLIADLPVAPPKVRQLANVGGREANVDDGGPVDSNEATRRARVAVRSEQPTLAGPAFHRAVLERARKDHPAAFSQPTN